jgi:D-threo-aldose 1-dehydrogenase
VNHADVAARFIRAAQPPGPDCVLLAGRYTLLDRSGLDDLLPLCVDRGITVMAAGVFQGGMLAAPHTAPPDLRDRIGTIRAACARYDVPPLAAAIQFPLRHPAVSCVVVGARAPHEIAESVALLDHPVPDDLWADLSR